MNIDSEIDTNTKAKRFAKYVEDFSCNNCGNTVKGNGFTNHCPNCLWSKHVDINPGDRKSECKGMMEPIASIYKKGEFIIAQRCKKCHITKRVKSSYNDNRDLLISLSINSFPHTY